MNRPVRTALAGVFAVGVAVATGFTAAGPASAAPTPAPAPLTCVDPRTGVALTATIVGTPGDDVIWATPGSVVKALGGDDIVFIDDVQTRALICLDGGADWSGPADPANVAVGSVSVRGGSGPDSITGATGNDILLGEADNDSLVGGPGMDTADGGDGTDRCDAESEMYCEF